MADRAAASVPRVFVSHAAHEAELAAQLVSLLQGVLELSAGEIAATSHASAELGASGIRERGPAADAAVFIAIVSMSSPVGGGELLMSARDARQSEAAPVGLRILLAQRGWERSMLPEPLRELRSVDGADEMALEDLVGEVAGQLRVAGTLDMAAQRGKMRELARAMDRGAARSRVRRRLLAAGVGALVAAGAVVVASGWGPRELATVERFGFERDADGWRCLDAEQGAGCVALRRSDEEAKAGDYALQLDVVLEPRNQSRRNAEVAWDAVGESGAPSQTGSTQPLDLRDKTVSLWVYATTGAEGEAESPNGLQLFVKDREWRSHYGAWTNIEPERWVQLSLSVGEAGDGEHVDESLEPAAIRLIGLKMSLGGKSQLPFEGPLFVDAVSWE